MTLDIANRLIEMRKKNGYSQEKLAELLGLSRQAVSKWERAEASPDTDNLILLSRLYGISLDELLNTNAADEEFVKEEKETEPEAPKKNDYVNISFRGIHVREKNGDEVHIGWDGIHVRDKKNAVDIGKEGVYVDGEEYAWRRETKWIGGVMMFLTIIAYVLIGSLYDLWHPGWLIFFAVPVVTSLVEAIAHRSAHRFAFPVLVTAGFLCLGFFYGSWHPGWVLFLTVPLYYMIFPGSRKNRGRDTKEKTNCCDKDEDNDETES